MAKRIKRTQIVDAASGEVLQENRETVYTSEAYMPGQGYRLYSRKHVRLGKYWNRPMKMNEWAWLMKVILHMDENNVTTDIDAIAKQFEVNRRRAYQIFAELKAHGAIAKVDGGYAVNPAIAFAGTYLSPQLYRLFKTDLDKNIPPWAKQRYEQEDAE